MARGEKMQVEVIPSDDFLDVLKGLNKDLDNIKKDLADIGYSLYPERYKLINGKPVKLNVR
jgi:hypothetical protein